MSSVCPSLSFSLLSGLFPSHPSFFSCLPFSVYLYSFLFDAADSGNGDDDDDI
jgi:hypothetical protein